MVGTKRAYLNSEFQSQNHCLLLLDTPARYEAILLGLNGLTIFTEITLQEASAKGSKFNEWGVGVARIQRSRNERRIVRDRNQQVVLQQNATSYHPFALSICSMSY